MKNKLRVLSLFSGIGAFEKALKNIGVDYELINYCEIDEHASKCYSVLHNVDESLNLYDVREVETNLLEDFELLTHGSPCQSFSIAGKQEGGEKDSGTRSSLLWESVRIIKAKKPKYVIWENVKNVLSSKHKPVFDEYLDELSKIGYVNHLPQKGFLNAKDFNIPQSRDRVFVVSILGGDSSYTFPKGNGLTRDLSEFIDFREKDDITYNFYAKYIEKKGNISEEEFANYIESLPISKGVGMKNLGLYNFDQLNRITTTSGLTGALSCRGVQNYTVKFWHNKKIYKPSPRMCWRLMGFTDEDFDKVKDIGKDKDLWDRAGNSIVVNVVEEIFKELFKNTQYLNK